MKERRKDKKRITSKKKMKSRNENEVEIFTKDK